MKIAALAFGLMAAAAVPATAQSAFEGAYFGFGLEYGRGGTSDPISDWTGDGDGDFRGAALAGFAGYNWAAGSWIFGAEVDLAVGNLQGDELCGNPSWTCTTEINRYASLRGRAGYQTGANSLVYGFVGPATARANLMTTDAGGVNYPGEETVTGYVVGIGLETPVGRLPGNLRVEVSRYNFGGEDFINDTTYSDVELDMTNITIGMVFKF